MSNPRTGTRDALQAASKPLYFIPKEFLGAFKCGHRKEVQEYIDEEIAWKLLRRIRKNPDDSEAREALSYLAQFNNEYYRGVLKKDDPEAIHNTPTLYKEVNDTRNAQRRDLIGAAKAGKHMGKEGEPYRPATLVDWAAEFERFITSQEDQDIPIAPETFLASLS